MKSHRRRSVCSDLAHIPLNLFDEKLISKHGPTARCDKGQAVVQGCRPDGGAYVQVPPNQRTVGLLRKLHELEGFIQGSGLSYLRFWRSEF